MSTPESEIARRLADIATEGDVRMGGYRLSDQDRTLLVHALIAKTHPNRVRLSRILNRHIPEDHLSLTDDAFVQAVIKDYTRELAQPLIDPNE